MATILVSPFIIVLQKFDIELVETARRRPVELGFLKFFCVGNTRKGEEEIEIVRKLFVFADKQVVIIVEILCLKFDAVSCENVGNTIAFMEGRRAFCLLYTSPSPRDQRGSRMPSSA